jgi:endonuclease/exonuclease/phosphatase (EEP) superfamily protein YafD
LLLLAPASLYVKRRALIPLTFAAIVLVVPLMGYRISWPFGMPSSGSSIRPSIKLVTFNADSAKQLDLTSLGEYLQTIGPDLVVFQEWIFPPATLFPAGEGRHVRVIGGQCVASRYPIRDLAYLDDVELGAGGGVAAYVVDFPSRSVHLFDVHLPTPRGGLQSLIDGGSDRLTVLRETLEHQWHSSDIGRRWVDRIDGPRILAGDFNLPQESPVFRRYWSSFESAFGSAGSGFGYTKWTRWFGARIDHVLFDPVWRARRCEIGPAVGSSHRPLFAELEWAESGR